MILTIEKESVIGHAVVVASESVFCYGVGGMVGSIGTIGYKGKISSKEWIGKLILAQEFSLPIKYPLNKLRKELWG